MLFQAKAGSREQGFIGDAVDEYFEKHDEEIKARLRKEVIDEVMKEAREEIEKERAKIAKEAEEKTRYKLSSSL